MTPDLILLLSHKPHLLLNQRVILVCWSAVCLHFFWSGFVPSAEKIKTTRKHKAALPRFVLQRALRPKSVTAHRKGGAVRPVVSRAGVLIKVLVKGENPFSLLGGAVKF